jgi:hypothetical protein
MACVVDVAETVSGVGLIISCAYRLSAFFCASVMLRRITADWIGFSGTVCDSPGLLDARDPNCVVHCVVGAVQRKPGAARAAGAPIDRNATRDAPFRSIVKDIINMDTAQQLNQQMNTIYWRDVSA